MDWESFPILQMECPHCGTLITLECNVRDFIRLEWYPRINGRYIAAAIVASHEPVAELNFSTDVGEATAIGSNCAVFADFEGIGADSPRDRYDTQVCVVHECSGGGAAGDRASILHPPPSRPTTT